MESIAARFRAGAWGSVGSVLITLLCTICFPVFHLKEFGEGFNAVVMAVLNNIVNILPLALLEAMLGFLYGIIRSGWKPSAWLRGMMIGALAWACLALPVACFGVLAVFFAGASPHGGPSFGEGLTYVLGLYFEQILCGTLAGILVELHQRRSVPREPI